MAGKEALCCRQDGNPTCNVDQHPMLFLEMAQLLLTRPVGAEGITVLPVPLLSERGESPLISASALEASFRRSTAVFLFRVQTIG